MKHFSVVTTGKYLSNEEYDIVYQAFSNFYKDATPKHRRRMKLTVIDSFDKNAYIWKKAEEYGIDDVMDIINRDYEDCEDIFENASVLFTPGQEAPLKVISKSLSFSVPIMGYHHLREQDLVDQTCSMLVRHRNNRDTCLEFSHLLNILYFDPEVRKILKRGAEEKYHSSFTWGGRVRVS